MSSRTKIENFNTNQFAIRIQVKVNICPTDLRCNVSQPYCLLGAPNRSAANRMSGKRDIGYTRSFLGYP